MESEKGDLFEDLCLGKVKLEFGNKEQIQAIDAVIAKHQVEHDQVAAQEAEDDEDTLKYYRVTLYFTCECQVDDVQACSEGEAIEKAKLCYDASDMEEYEIEHEEAIVTGIVPTGEEEE